MIKSKKQIILVAIMSLLIIFLTISTYSYFQYRRSGASNNIRVGHVSFLHTESNTISLSNAYPIDVSGGIPSNSPNVGSFTINITGDTDYEEGIEYLISIDNSSLMTSNGKRVPVSLNLTMNNMGTSSDSYFTARENTNISIYKKLIGDTISGDEDILVGFIVQNSTQGTVSGINGSINIKAYLDASKIEIINDDSVFTLAGKDVFTFSEWNTLQNDGISFEIKVQAKEGIWVEGPTPEACFISSDNGDGTVTIDGYERTAYYNYRVNTNMTEEEIANCTSYFTVNPPENGGGGLLYAPTDLSNLKVRFLDTMSQEEAFCRGTGMIDGKTFQEYVDDGEFNDSALYKMIRNKYLIAQNDLPNECDTSNIIIPEKIDGNIVTIIGDYAFTEKNLYSVIIPNSVTFIGRNSFSSNILRSVTIPNSVTTIDFGAFQGNYLESVTLGNSILTIGDDAFGNNMLTNVVIPYSVTDIGAYAFSHNKLTIVNIPNSVTTIGDAAFASNQLTNVTIPNSVISIGMNAFSYNQLTSVTIGKGITSIGSNAFEKYDTSNTNLSSIRIDKSCTDIKNNLKVGNSNNYPWIGSSNRAGTTIYGTNNEICDSW